MKTCDAILCLLLFGGVEEPILKTKQAYHVALAMIFLTSAALIAHFASQGSVPGWIILSSLLALIFPGLVCLLLYPIVMIAYIVVLSAFFLPLGYIFDHVKEIIKVMKK